MAFRAATYNVLATAYLGRGDYSTVPTALLDPELRVPALVRHVISMDAELLCLQEVEAEVFVALQVALAPLGYAGQLALKGKGKPDGCATLFRTGVLAFHSSLRVEFADDGHVVLLLALEHDSRLLGVANTHLRWDRPGTPQHKQVGYRQAVELLDACRRFQPACHGWVICGDFNRKPDSDVVALFGQAGFQFAHAGRRHVCSAVANGRASLIDYIFHTKELSARPIDPPLVSDGDVLPSPEQPSDHLALLAELAWVGGGTTR
jgi:mRNA deadenylase 3'-5' endonuclease subunit Ccr4